MKPITILLALFVVLAVATHVAPVATKHMVQAEERVLLKKTILVGSLLFLAKKKALLLGSGSSRRWYYRGWPVGPQFPPLIARSFFSSTIKRLLPEAFI